MLAAKAATAPPASEKLALYLAAVHPGRDVYLGGAAIRTNIQVWATVGKVLIELRDAYAAEHEQRGGLEAGLSPALAAKALEVAKAADAELSRNTLPELERQVIEKLVKLGHTKVLSKGPHASLAAEIAAGVEDTTEQLAAAERSLTTLTLGMWR